MMPIILQGLICVCVCVDIFKICTFTLYVYFVFKVIDRFY